MADDYPDVYIPGYSDPLPDAAAADVPAVEFGSDEFSDVFIPGYNSESTSGADEFSDVFIPGYRGDTLAAPVAQARETPAMTFPPIAMEPGPSFKDNPGAWVRERNLEEGDDGGMAIHPMLPPGAGLMGGIVPTGYTTRDTIEGKAVILDSGGLASVFASLDLPLMTVRSIAGYLNIEPGERMYWMRDLADSQAKAFSNSMSQADLSTVGGKVAYGVGQTANTVAYTAGYLKFMRSMGMRYGGGGATAAQKAVWARSLGRVFNALKMGGFKALLLSEGADPKEKADIFKLAFLYSATPALSGLAPNHPAAKAADLVLNSIITAFKEGGYADIFNTPKEYRETGNLFRNPEGRTSFEQWVEVMKELGSDVVFSAMTTSLGQEAREVVARHEEAFADYAAQRSAKIGAAESTASELSSMPERTPAQDAELGKAMAMLEVEKPDSPIVQERLRQARERATELSGKSTLNEADAKEFGAVVTYLERLAPREAFAAMAERIKADSESMSKSEPFILTREQIATASAADLREMAERLSSIYGRKVETPEIRDAFGSRMQRVLRQTPKEQRVAQSSAIKDLYQQVVDRKKTGAEFLEDLGNMNPRYRQEFVERTTGSDPEKPSSVVRDMAKSMEEGRVVDESKPETATEKPGEPAAEAKPAPASAEGQAAKQEIKNEDGSVHVVRRVREDGSEAKSFVQTISGLRAGDTYDTGLAVKAIAFEDDTGATAPSGNIWTDKQYVKEVVGKNEIIVGTRRATDAEMDKMRRDFEVILKEDGVDAVDPKEASALGYVQEGDTYVRKSGGPSKPAPASAEGQTAEQAIQGKIHEKTSEEIDRYIQGNGPERSRPVRTKELPPVADGKVRFFHGIKDISDIPSMLNNGVLVRSNQSAEQEHFVSGWKDPSDTSFGSVRLAIDVPFSDIRGSGSQVAVDRNILPEEIIAVVRDPKPVGAEESKDIEDRIRQKAPITESELKRYFINAPKNYTGIIISEASSKPAPAIAEGQAAAVEARDVSGAKPASPLAGMQDAQRTTQEAPAKQAPEGIDKNVPLPRPTDNIVKWEADMASFARVAAGVKGYSKAQFIKDMESDDILHPKADAADIARIYDAAKAGLAKVAAAQRTVPQLRATERVMKGALKAPEATVEARVSEILKAMMKSMQKGSQDGWKGAMSEARRLYREDRAAAKTMQRQMQDELNTLEGATKGEKDRLRILLAEVGSKTTTGRATAFDKFMDRLEAVKANIDDRKNRFELVPYPDATTASGVDANSRYQDIRATYIEKGGSPSVTSKTAMLNYLNGDPKRAATMDVVQEVESLRSRKSPEQRDQDKLIAASVDEVMRKYPWLLNLNDFFRVVSRGVEDSAIVRIVTRISQDVRKNGDLLRELEGISSEVDPKGVSVKALGKAVKTVKLHTGRVQKFDLGEIMLIDASLSVADNRKALESLRFVPERGDKKSFTATAKQYQAIVDEALRQATPQERKAYDTAMKLLESLTDATGTMLKPVANELFKRLGIDREFVPVERRYVPIKIGGAEKDRRGMTLELPGGTVFEVGENYLWSIVNQSRMQERTGGAESGFIRVGKLDKVLSSMITDAASFASKAPTQIDAMLLTGNHDLRAAISETFGDRFLNAMTEKVKQYTGTLVVPQRGASEWFVSAMFSIADLSRLSRPSTQYIMGSSLQLARPYLHREESILPGMAHALDKVFRDRFEADGFSYMRYKGGASYSAEFAERATKMKEHSGGWTWNKAMQRLISAGDQAAIRALYAAAAFDTLAAEGRPMTMESIKAQDDAFWNRVGDKAASIAMRTQPSGDASAVNVLKGRATHNLFWRVLTRYGSQGSRIFNNVFDAMDEYSYNPTEANRERLRRTVDSNIVINVSNMAVAKSVRGPIKALLWGALYAMFGLEEQAEEQAERYDKMVEGLGAKMFQEAIKAVAGNVDLVRPTANVILYLVGASQDHGQNVADSEARMIKDAVTSTIRMHKWGKAIDDMAWTGGGEYASGPNKKSQKQIRKLYEDATKRALIKWRDVAGVVGRFPPATGLVGGMELYEGMLSEQMAERR